MIPSAFLALAATHGLSAADTDAAFRAAGFEWRARSWRSDCPDLGYQSGRLRRVADLNGDGRPEAIITEGGVVCFGNTGTRFSIVSKGRDGRWRLVARNLGIPHLLPVSGPERWPDIEIGLPGMCTPVWRWSGRAYAFHHFSRAAAPHCRARNGR